MRDVYGVKISCKFSYEYGGLDWNRSHGLRIGNGPTM